MTSREAQGQRLERLVARALSELPPRRAPASLERRVIEALERRDGRAAETGFSGERSRQGGFATWPLAGRAALVASCLASVGVVLLGLKELAIRLALLAAEPGIALRLQGLRDLGKAAAALGALLARLLRMIPAEWLIGGLLATAVLYSLLFGLLTLGYSTLYATPERSRS